MKNELFLTGDLYCWIGIEDDLYQCVKHIVTDEITQVYQFLNLRNKDFFKFGFSHNEKINLIKVT
jgi:hypothetical protein